jgi:hypothetical protein
MGGDLTGYMSAGLNSLGNDNVYSCLLRAGGCFHRANLMEHSDTGSVGCRYEFRRISPEKR